jgi:tetratricopeptide (TPR) repeat protein
MSTLLSPPNQFRSFKAGSMRTPLLWAVLLSFLMIPFSAPAVASGDFEPGSCRAEEIFPADTILCVKLSGVNRLMADRESFDLFQIWKEGEVQEFFKETIEMLPDVLGVAASPPFPVDEIWPFLEGEMTFAIGRRLVIVGENAFPSMALAVDMGSGREAFLSRLEGLLDLIGGAGRAERGTFEHRGFTINSIGSSDERKTVCFTTVDNLFLATINRHHLCELLDGRLDGKPTLADNDAFARCKAKAGGTASRGLVFTNFEPFIETLSPYCPREIIDAIALLGLTNVDAFCLSTAIENRGSRDSLFIDCPGEKTGLLGAIAPRPLSGETFEGVPADTVFFFGLAFDPGLLLKEIESIVKKTIPEHHAQLRRDLDAFRGETGFDLEKEILASLGDEITFFASIPKTGGMTMIPDMILRVTLGDEEAFDGLREKLLAMARGRLEVVETEFKERVLHHVTLPQRGIPLAPTFAVDEGRLLVAGTPLAMKRYLKWLDAEGPGLTSTPGFGEAMIGVPDSASMIEYVDLRRITGFGYENGAPFLASVLPQSGLPLDAGMLPLSETITDHMSSAVGYVAIDEQGVMISARCPFGASVLLSLGVTITDYMIENDFIAGLLMRQASQVVAPPAATPPDPALGQAIAQKNSSDFEAAENGFTAWIIRHPDHPHLTKALTCRGECRMEIRRYADAYADFKAVAERDATCRGLACCNMARAAAHLDDADASIGALEQAILAGFRIFELPVELERFSGEERLILFIDMVTGAANLIRDGNYEEADQLFTEWIYANPYHDVGAWALKSRGECRMKLKRRQAAIADFKAAAERNPDYRSQVYYDVACCHAILGDGDRAIDSLAKAIEAGFDDFDLMDFDPDLDGLRNNPKFKALRWTW